MYGVLTVVELYGEGSLARTLRSLQLGPSFKFPDPGIGYRLDDLQGMTTELEAITWRLIRKEIRYGDLPFAGEPDKSVRID